MKFYAVAVLTFVTTSTASDNQDRSLHRWHGKCPPPQYPPPPPRADGRPWVWVCRPKPSSSWNDKWQDESSGEAVKWQDDGHETDDNTWAGDGHAVEEDDDNGWSGDSHAVETTDDDWQGDGHVESDDDSDDENWDGEEDDGNGWSGDSHANETDDDWKGDGHVESNDDGDDETWDGDGHEEENDDGIEDVDSWGDDETADRDPTISADGEEEVDSWGDDETADRQPVITDALIEEEGVHHEQDSKSVPIGAIAGAAAAAVAAIAALAVFRRRRNDNEFIDIDDKNSIATSVTPPPEARMAKDDDIEIDHTFFDENLFQENYREQELAYSDLYPENDPSPINEDLGYTGDDVSI